VVACLLRQRTDYALEVVEFRRHEVPSLNTLQGFCMFRCVIEWWNPSYNVKQAVAFAVGPLGRAVASVAS
jgi:hypothetical protein